MSRIMALIAGLVLTATLPIAEGCSKKAESTARTSAPVAEIAVIGHGEKVKLTDHLVPGKTTVVDFYSEYCGGCQMLAPELEKLVRQRPDIAVVKVDVNRPEVEGRIDWDSPVAQQYGLESLPHLVVFDPDGTVKASGDRALDLVLGWLEA